MFRTLSLDKAISCSPSIVQHGTLFLSSDYASYSPTIHQIIDDLEVIDLETSYKERVEIWVKNEICVTDIWIGDISNLVEVGADVKYKSEFGKPEHVKIFSIYPDSLIGVIEFNLRNIATASKHIGTLEQYKSDYISFLEEHRDSLFLMDRINKDIDTIQTEYLRSNYYGLGGYSFGVADWYNAFEDKQESLNLNDYKIWISPRDEIQVFSSRSSYSSPRRLMCLLDKSQDVLNAAKGYLYHQVLPFLKDVQKSYNEEFFPVTESDDFQSQVIESELKLIWKGDKTDLAELVWALAKSGRVTDTSTGKDATQKVLAKQIANLLGIDLLDVVNLMKGRMNTYKATSVA